jgi:hypothetical protein
MRCADGFPSVFQNARMVGRRLPPTHCLVTTIPAGASAVFYPAENWLIWLIGLIYSVLGVQWNQSNRR